MTDRSNYGPVRRLSPSVSTDNRKPYSRTGLKGVLGTLDLNSGDTAVPTPSDSPYYPFHVEIPQLEAPTQNRTSVPDGPRDIAGFPTYEQYQRIEGEYLSSLSERKQPKALISQALFDKVFAVLQNGSEDRGSTAQFRFWVRKMFAFAYPQTSFDRNAGRTPEPVVLHDKRPVAIKEQLYEVLCYCHGVSRHGGRDKTCATLRLNYSWVPKELTAKFVKACPTCTLKRSGNPDLLSQFGQTVSSSSSSSPYASQPTATVPSEPASLPVLSGGPNDSPPGLSFVVGSEGCDDGGGGGSVGFGPSMFATPDLSVYPSPTLSAGSLGPATPSPYLHGGLFGYPAVFDPGHGSLSSVAGWDTSSLSPCGLMYPEELHAGVSKQQKAPVSTAEEVSCSQDTQLQLPAQKIDHPLRTRAHSGDCDNGGGDNDDDDGDDDDDGGYSADPLLPCTTDMGNIDPVLLTKSGYSPFALAGTAPNDSSSSNSASRIFQHYRHQHQHQQQQQQQQQDPHVSLPPPQLGLALGTTTTLTAMGGEQPASISERRRQRRLLHLSHPAHDARSFSSRDAPEFLLSLPPPPPPPPPPGTTSSNSAQLPLPMPYPVSRGDHNNPLMNMIMFKFGPPSRARRATGPSPPGVQVIAAPMPVTTTTAAAAAAPVLGMEIEEEDEDEKDEVQLEEANANVVFDTEKTRTPQLSVGAGSLGGVDDQAAAAGRRCRWDSPEAWLVQSDSIDGEEEVSVAAMA